MMSIFSHWHWIQTTNWLSNVLEFIILIQPFLFAMFKTQINNPQPAIFSPSNAVITQAIHDDAICLHANAFTNRHFTQELRLAMTNFYLAICSPHSQFSQYLYYAELEFNLKFQVIYQEDGKVNLQLGPSSKKIGFRLIRQKNQFIDLYFKSEPLLQIWLKYLSKNLNQYGFHKLYKPVKKLGKGGFATVYEVQRLTDKAHFAAKAFAKASTINSSNPANRSVLLNQIDMLRTFDNPNIMKLEAVFQSENSLYIILELLPDSQVHTRINQRMAKFTQEQVKTFMRGMARALYEMHKCKIMHRDIKPQNIMLRGATGLNPVIADFGLAAIVDSEDYIFYRCGTPGYVAPEVISCKKGDRLTTACDIFSTGLIFHILLLRRPLFEGRSSQEVYENNRKCKFNLCTPMYERVDPEALNLLRRMLALNPKERITAEEMLTHPFIFQGLQMQGQKQTISPATTTASFLPNNFGEAEHAF